MKNSLRNKLEMYRSVQVVIDSYNGSWSGIPAFATAYARFANKLSQLEEFGVLQASILVGKASAKQAKRNEAVDVFHRAAGALYVYAVQTSNSELKEQSALIRNDFLRGPIVNSIEYMDMIITLITDHLSDLTSVGVDQNMLDELITVRDELDAIKGTPRSAIMTRKTITSAMDAAAKEITGILMEELDKLVLFLKPTDPAFYDEYFANRVIHDRRARFTSGSEEEGTPSVPEPTDPQDPGSTTNPGDSTSPNLNANGAE